MKITVVGAGYVGLSLATLISQKFNVSLLDIDEKKVSQLKKKKSPVTDKYIEDFLAKKNLNLNPTTNPKEAYENSDYIIIATNTNYEPEKGSFDTSSVEAVICQAKKYSSNAMIVIKSTLPLGFTEKARLIHNDKNIIFSPEFLREGHALYDNLYPSRIIIGDSTQKAKEFAKILIDCSLVDRDNLDTHFVASAEAEAIKLFANTYLAMRVSFFNELDSFSEINKLSSKNIIEGVCADPRIGNYYNNPSFGYGGYCLPKDTKQLLSNFDKIPSNLIKAIIDSNQTRKNFIAESIIKKKPNSVGVYRLTMKTNSDNFRESAIFDVAKIIEKNNIKIFLYEPFLTSNLENMELVENLREFVKKSDIIIANRISSDLELMKNKIYTRDIFEDN